MPADAAPGQHWSPDAAQARQGTGAYPAYGVGEPQPGTVGQALPRAEQPAYQPQPAQQQPGYPVAQQPPYQGGARQQAAGPGTGATSAYPQATGGQPAAYPATTGQAANGYAPNGQAANGYAADSRSSNAYPGTGYAPGGTGAFPVNGQDANGYGPIGHSANGHDAGNGYRPAPDAPQPVGTPSFTPTFSPNGGPNSTQNGPRQPGRPGENPGQNGQPGSAYPAAPGYQNGADYPAAGLSGELAGRPSGASAPRPGLSRQPRPDRPVGDGSSVVAGLRPGRPVRPVSADLLGVSRRSGPMGRLLRNRDTLRRVKLIVPVRLGSPGPHLISPSRNTVRLEPRCASRRGGDLSHRRYIGKPLAICGQGFSVSRHLLFSRSRRRER